MPKKTADETFELLQPLERLSRLMRAIEHERGLNPAQWEALRFLARTNRFSNSPGALTRYLGATKGTISQTVMALQRKGLIAKSARTGRRATVSLTLTPKGEEMLQGDPWSRVATAAAELGDKTKRRMVKGLTVLLAGELAHSGHRSFGLCRDSRFFRERGRPPDAAGPHVCMLFDEALAEQETQRICVEHEPA